MEIWFDPETIKKWLIILQILLILLSVSLIKLFNIHQTYLSDRRQKLSTFRREYEHRLVQTSILAREQEKKRIAADLHESIIGKLTVLQLKNELKHPQDEIGFLLEEIIHETRHISHHLIPPMIDYKCVDDLIYDVLMPWRHHFYILYYKNIQDRSSISKNLKLHIIRILQELITNIQKHAQSETIIVKYKKTQNYLYLMVADEGIGFDPESQTANQGIGLSNLASRVKHLNGHYKIDSDKTGTRFCFLFTLPTPKKNEKYTDSHYR